MLYVNEVRMALRERNTIINSLLIPIFLYPTIFWLMVTGFTFVQGRSAGQVSRIQIINLPATHAGFRKQLAGEKQVQLLDTARNQSDASKRILQGDLDLLIVFQPPRHSSTLADDYQVQVVYNGAKDRSNTARDRADDSLYNYRKSWLKGAVTKAGLTEAQWKVFTLDMRDTASEREMGSYLLGMLLPLIFVIMVAIGCFYPAVDTLAGERERQTWESLMTLAVPRSSIFTAKYLMVATFGCLAGILNLTVMTLTMRPLLAPLFAGQSIPITFSLSPAGFPLIVLGAALLAALVAALMLLFAAFSRTFKEGQAMITPVYLLSILPAMLVAGPEIPFTTGLAFIPLANVAMVVREAIAGTFHWPQIGITLAVTLALIMGSLSLITAIFRAEDVLVGSYDGNLLLYLKQRVFSRPGRK
ncbi:MAG: ABC transporter permease [Armatimonadota bacterium]